MAAAVESPEFRFQRVVEANSSPSSADSSFRELDDAFLQTQTRIWLGEVLGTTFDEEANIADLLADGQLLFQVSELIGRMLTTTSVDIGQVKLLEMQSFPSSKSTRRYMHYFNVASFIRVCQLLGLSGIDLFTPSDVVEKREARKVCMCIRLFSKKARSRNLNVPDFDVVTSSFSMSTDMVESIRRSLELSQCNSPVSLSSDASTGSRQRQWQRESSATFDGNDDHFSHGYDKGDSTCLSLESFALSPADSHTTAPRVIRDSHVVGDQISTQVGFPSHLAEKEDAIKGQHRPESITESVGSPCSQTYTNHYDNCTPFLSCLGSHSNYAIRGESILVDCGSGVRNHDPFRLDYYQENSSGMEDCGDSNSAEANSSFHNLEGSGTCCCCNASSFDPGVNMLFEVDENNSLMSSNLSHPSRGIRYKNGSFGLIEDADFMSSTTAIQMNLDLPHNCVKEDQFMTGGIQSYPLLEHCANHLFRNNMEKIGSPDIIRKNGVCKFISKIDVVNCDMDDEVDELLDLPPSGNDLHLPATREREDCGLYDTGFCVVDLHSEVGNVSDASFDEENAWCENATGISVKQLLCTAESEDETGGLCVMSGMLHGVDDHTSEIVSLMLPLDADAPLKDKFVGLIKEADNEETFRSSNSSSDLRMSIAKNEPSGNPDALPLKITVTGSIKCQDGRDEDEGNSGFKKVPHLTGEHKLASGIWDSQLKQLELANKDLEFAGHKNHDACIRGKDPLVDKDDAPWGNENKVAPKHRSSGTFLKSVVRGTALAGVLLFLLHFRKRKEEDRKASRPAGGIRNGNGNGNARKYSSHKAKEAVTALGVYPSEKLQFGMK